MLEHMYITIPVHEKIFIKQGQVHPEGLKNSSEIVPFFQYSFNTVQTTSGRKSNHPILVVQKCIFNHQNSKGLNSPAPHQFYSGE